MKAKIAVLKNGKEKKKAVLTGEEIDILKRAREILRKLSKEYKRRYCKVEDAFDYLPEEEKLGKWLDELYKTVKVDFDCSGYAAFIDIGIKY